MTAHDATNWIQRPVARLAIVIGSVILLGCSIPQRIVPRHPPPPIVTDGTFVMPDGARLPYREWLPAGDPAVVMLALHGIDDSRDAWEKPGPILATKGIAVIAPDERGFGAATGRGRWPGYRDHGDGRARDGADGA